MLWARSAVQVTQVALRVSWGPAALETGKNPIGFFSKCNQDNNIIERGWECIARYVVEMALVNAQVLQP